MSDTDPAPEARLDPSVLDQVRQLSAVRPGLLANLVRMFEQNTRQMLEDTPARLDGTDWEWLRINYHSLKGTSASLGARRLSQIAYLLEQAASEEAPAETLRPLVQQVEAEFEGVLAELQQEAAR